MFHDFDHPGRTGNDDLNIIIALRGLRKHLLPEDEEMWVVIESLIQATEFPHRTPSHELSLLAQILRDADMSQALSVAWIQQIIFGLAVEMNMTPRKVLEMQSVFLGSLKFSTAWANTQFPPQVIDDKIQEAKGLLECLPA